MMKRHIRSILITGFVCVLAPAAGAAEAGRGEVYSVVELSFRGPHQAPKDNPAREIEFWALLRHESGSPEYKVHGFWDGDGRGGLSGDVFKIRFCPTRPGRWSLVEVHSNVTQLRGQRQGDHVTAVASKHRGFWIPDPASAGGRWYMRSDGSRQYVTGNTMYSFLSGYGQDNQPSGNDIARDVTANAAYFKKIRFSLFGDRYPHPAEKPFLDEEGRLTDSGDYSHRPNPKWFHERVDLAVRTAYRHDLIADLILCGPDTEESRSTLRAAANGGDAAPYLRYIAARYGSYPNVWICLANEWDIKKPSYTAREIAGFGRTIRGVLPYSTPVSVHPGGKILWAQAFDEPPAWHDHHIIQRKIRELPVAADVMHSVWISAEGQVPRTKPTVNDELSYEGEGDKHSEGDTIESRFGAFLGGGYASTGFKPGFKTGHYFWGKFDPSEHTAADNLKFLREVIDGNISFWRMAPGAGVFANLDADFRGMEWPGREYVLGTNKARQGVVAQLPPGKWRVQRFDIVTKEAATLSTAASGEFRFDAPASRAVLFHFKKEGAGYLSRLRVSDNQRYLVEEDGTPFFWLGDTAWALIRKAVREDAADQPAIRRYFANRAAKGFNVVQTCLVGDEETPNAYGQPPFVGGDFTRPRILEGPDNDYWDMVDYLIELAEKHGIYMALLPIWADSIPNGHPMEKDPSVAYGYGRFVGSRHRGKPHIIWVLGGDAAKERDVDNPARLAMIRAMAEGIADGTNGVAQYDGKADYGTTLMTYHPRGGGQSSSRLLHAEEWLDFNMIQTTTRFEFTNYETVAADYAMTPPKPTLDAEVAYEYSLSLRRTEPQDRRIGPWQVRKAAYWNVFAGGFGHTYGHRSDILWVRDGESLRFGADVPWYRSLDAPGTFQVSHLRRLMESRPFLVCVPDPSLIAEGEGEGLDRAVATRASDGSYGMVYLPTGKPVSVRMAKISGGKVRAFWFDPRKAVSRRIGEFPAQGAVAFTPPSSGDENDWVLVLDDASKGFAPPGPLER